MSAASLTDAEMLRRAAINNTICRPHFQEMFSILFSIVSRVPLISAPKFREDNIASGENYRKEQINKELARRGELTEENKAALISLVALLVKVIAKILLGSIPFSTK